MGLFDNLGRWTAGRLGGTAAVEKWDAARKKDKDNVLGDAAKKLAQQKIVERYKPDAIRIVDDWKEVAKTKLGLLTPDSVEREIIRLIERTDLVPAAAAVVIQLAISELFDSFDAGTLIAQGPEGIEALAEKIKTAIWGARL